MIYKNFPRTGTDADNLLDIKNRVTAAINAGKSASPYTSETPQRSPLSDSNIPFFQTDVNGTGEKSSEVLWWELFVEADFGTAGRILPFHALVQESLCCKCGSSGGKC